MKIHFSQSSLGKLRLNKVKAVAGLTKTELTEVAWDEKSDFAKNCHYNSLPILETPHGCLFSSNTIVRYLATLSKSLYGSNPHEQALVDQWLDITACELEPAAGAVLLAVGGREVDCEKVHADVEKFFKFLDGHLNGKKFLVGNALSIADVSVASNVQVVLGHALGEEERKKYAHLTEWFNSVHAQAANWLGQFKLAAKVHGSLSAKKKEEKKEEHGKGHGKEHGKDHAKDHGKDHAKEHGKDHGKEHGKDHGKKGGKKEEAKEVAKEPAADFDPFADDEPAAPAPAPKPVEKPAEKKKKVTVAKSIVIFDLKVYDQETDLKALADKVFKQITMDGLVWNKDYKILPVAFGMNKLQFGCVIEDEKISTDDMFEKIQEWEDVQSIDVVSFNKV